MDKIRDRRYYHDYPPDEEDWEDMSNGEALAVCIIITTIFVVPIHYVVAMVGWLFGKRVPVNPLKVIPSYLILLTAGFGALCSIGEFNQ